MESVIKFGYIWGVFIIKIKMYFIIWIDDDMLNGCKDKWFFLVLVRGVVFDLLDSFDKFVVDGNVFFFIFVVVFYIWCFVNCDLVN